MPRVIINRQKTPCEHSKLYDRVRAPVFMILISLNQNDILKVKKETERYFSEVIPHRKRNGKHRFQAFDNDYQDAMMIDCFGAECAVAKFVNVSWPNKGTMDGPDVGEWIQVKRIDPKLPKNVNLLIQQKLDKRRPIESYAYVLVSGSIPTFEIIGWIGGADAKEVWIEFGKTDRGDPFYLVKKEHLSTEWELLKKIAN